MTGARVENGKVWEIFCTNKYTDVTQVAIGLHQRSHWRTCRRRGWSLFLARCCWWSPEWRSLECRTRGSRCAVRPASEHCEMPSHTHRLILIPDEHVGVQVKLWNPLRTRAIPERRSQWSSGSNVACLTAVREVLGSNRAAGSCVYRTTTVIYSLGQCLGQLSFLPFMGR